MTSSTRLLSRLLLAAAFLLSGWCLGSLPEGTESRQADAGVTTWVHNADQVNSPRLIRNSGCDGQLATTSGFTSTLPQDGGLHAAGDFAFVFNGRLRGEEAWLEAVQPGPPLVSQHIRLQV